MRRYQIEAPEQTTADPATVYALLRDGSTWPVWSTIDSFELERAGDGEPEGVGAVRIFRKGRYTGRDTVVGFTPDRSFRYAHKGLPVRDYRGEIELTAIDDGGTSIRWRVSYSSLIPGTGWLLRKGLTGFVGELVGGLASYSSRKAGFVG
jgi:polyketide cyclase/dehydrase/lipid transport protein